MANMSGNWSFAARAVGLWPDKQGCLENTDDADQELQILEPVINTGCRITHLHLEVASDANNAVRLSFLEAFGAPPSEPCIVVYCPSEATGGANCSEAAQMAQMMLPIGIHVMAIDVSRSRKICDADDISCAVKFVRSRRFRKEHGWPLPGAGLQDGEQLPSIVLWGRSMGANAAIRYASTDQCLMGLVCDSAYSDIPSLVGLPSWISSPFAGLRRMAGDVVQTGSCAAATGRVAEVATAVSTMAPPWELASTLWMPALYVHGGVDTNVPSICARTLRNAHAGESQLLIVSDGTHDSTRPASVTAQMSLFAHRAFQRSRTTTDAFDAQVRNVVEIATGKSSTCVVTPGCTPKKSELQQDGESVPRHPPLAGASMLCRPAHPLGYAATMGSSLSGGSCSPGRCPSDAIVAPACWNTHSPTSKYSHQLLQHIFADGGPTSDSTMVADPVKNVAQECSDASLPHVPYAIRTIPVRNSTLCSANRSANMDVSIPSAQLPGAVEASLTSEGTENTKQVSGACAAMSASQKVSYVRAGNNPVVGSNCSIASGEVMRLPSGFSGFTFGPGQRPSQGIPSLASPVHTDISSVSPFRSLALSAAVSPAFGLRAYACNQQTLQDGMTLTLSASMPFSDVHLTQSVKTAPVAAPFGETMEASVSDNFAAEASSWPLCNEKPPYRRPSSWQFGDVS